MSHDPLLDYTRHPSHLKVLKMHLIKHNEPQDLQTVTAALIGIRYDLHRVIELLEHDRDCCR
jgi:hypothetical protein